MVGELLEGALRVRAVCPVDEVLDRCRALGAEDLPELLEVGLDVHRGVPDVEVALRRHVDEGLAIDPRSRQHRVHDHRLGRALAAERHRGRGHQALQVPLEGAREGLIEVVDIEDQPALRREVGAEVGDVGIPAELHVDAGRGAQRQVVGHRRSGAPQEGELVCGHALVAERHQARDAGLALDLEQRHRVEARRAVSQLAEQLAGQRLAAGLACCLGRGGSRRLDRDLVAHFGSPPLTGAMTRSTAAGTSGRGSWRSRGPSRPPIRAMSAVLKMTIWMGKATTALDQTLTVARVSGALISEVR